MRTPAETAERSDWPSRIIDMFTVSPSGGRIERAPELIVYVPYGSQLEVGFEAAKNLAPQRVRVIGMGATLERTWPDWARSSPNIECTELWAYRPRSPILATRELKHAVDAWLDENLHEASPHMPAASAYYGTACARLFQALFIFWPDVLGLVEHHGTSTIHVIDPSWLGLDVLRSAARDAGGTVLSGERGPATSSNWRLRLAAYGAVGLGATIVEQIRDYALSRRALREIETRRRTVAADPDYWLVLLGEVPRANIPVVDALGLPLVEGGSQLGVLVQSSLVPGERDEVRKRRRTGRHLWAGLGALLPHVDACHLDQLVSPPDPASFAAGLFDATLRSIRTLRRISTSGGMFRVGAVNIDLTPRVREVAKLATIDIARSTLAEAATDRFVAKTDLRDKTVVFACTGASPGARYINMICRRSGARTVEIAHGSLGTGEPGAREPHDKTTCVWTEADARVLAPLGAPMVVAGMPARVTARPRAVGHPRNVLIVSNYLHRDYLEMGRSPLEPFNVELLSTSAAIWTVFGEDTRVRWRPHPADDVAGVERLSRQFAKVERSTEKRLENDVSWADLIVISMSSSTYEVLFAGVPVFVQVTPDYEGTPAADFVQSSRRFFRSAELEPLLTRFRAELTLSPDEALAPERAALEDLFGKTGQPTSVLHALENVE